MNKKTIFFLGFNMALPHISFFILKYYSILGFYAFATFIKLQLLITNNAFLENINLIINSREISTIGDHFLLIFSGLLNFILFMIVIYPFTLILKKKKDSV